MTATNTTSRSRRETVTPAATGAVIEPCALLVTEVEVVDELKVDPLVRTAEQRRYTYKTNRVSYPIQSLFHSRACFNVCDLELRLKYPL